MNIINMTYSESSDFDMPTDGKRFYRGMQKANRVFGVDLRDTGRKGIKSKQKTGRFYMYKGKAHRASAQGEYPANRSGNLMKKTVYKVTGLIMEFGTRGVSYAPILQQYPNAKTRTSNWSRIAPRPYLTLAHDAVFKNNPVAQMRSSVQSAMGL